MRNKAAQQESKQKRSMSSFFPQEDYQENGLIYSIYLIYPFNSWFIIHLAWSLDCKSSTRLPHHTTTYPNNATGRKLGSVPTVRRIQGLPSLWSIMS